MCNIIDSCKNAPPKSIWFNLIYLYKYNIMILIISIYKKYSYKYLFKCIFMMLILLFKKIKYIFMSVYILCQLSWYCIFVYLY